MALATRTFSSFCAGLTVCRTFPSALTVYDCTKAIELDGKNHVFYSNCSAAYMNLGKKNEALNDAKTAAMAEAIASSLEVVGDAAVRAKSAESGGPGPSTSLVPDAADGMARLRTSAMVLGRPRARRT